MITHVLLLDKKLGPTLSTINFLEHVRPIASCVLLVCVAIYFRAALANPTPFIRPLRKIRPIEEEAALALSVAAEKA